MSYSYLRFDDPEIPGDSKAPGPVGEIELIGWDHGFAPAPTERASTAAPHAFNPFRVIKRVDAASCTLLDYGWSGKQIGGAVLRCYDGHRRRYLTVALDHIVIRDIAIGTGEGGLVSETLTLDCGTVTYTYVPLRDGEVPPSFRASAR